jgi:hypothetical protein
MLFKLSRDSDNDKIFFEETFPSINFADNLIITGFIYINNSFSLPKQAFVTHNGTDLLVSVLEQADRVENADALLYTCGVIKNTSSEGKE